MRQTANLNSVTGSLSLPGTVTNTSPTDYRINKQMQMMKFNGERWELFGPIIEDAGPVKQLGSIGGSPPASHCPRRRRSRFGTVSSSPRPATAAGETSGFFLCNRSRCLCFGRCWCRT
jgi:hypothetical protein